MTFLMITIHVEEASGERRAIEIPTDIQLTLMEVLKAAEYPIQATCGGMALCATCHVEVVEGENHYKEATDPELEMLDTLPEVTDASRLACQMPIQEAMDGLVVRILAGTEDGYV